MNSRNASERAGKGFSVKLCLSVVLLVLGTLAHAEDPDSDGVHVHVGVLRRRLIAAGENHPEVLRWVVERQNGFPHSLLNAREFFDFYHELLGKMTAQNRDASAFLRATQTLYDAFRPSWEEVKRGIAVAGPQPAKKLLVANQSNFFLLHVPADAPDLTVKGLAILAKLPKLPQSTTDAVWGSVLPGILAPPEGISEADHFFTVYDSILLALSGSPNELVAFYKDTAGQYRSFQPSAKRILQSAEAIHIAIGRSFDEHQGSYGFPAIRNWNEGYDFVWFQLLRPETRRDYGAALELIQAYKELLKLEPVELPRVLQHLQATQRYFSYNWPRDEEYPALKTAINARTARYQVLGRGKDIVAILESFEPAQIDQHGLPQVENILGELDAKTETPDAGHEFLAKLLERAADLPSFERIFHLLTSRDQRARAQRIADSRLATWRDWSPTAERLRAVHGGAMVNAAKVREMNRPDYFLTLFADALALHRWEDPDELEAFAVERIEPFFASGPTVPQMFELLVLLRDKPVPQAREDIEGRALTAMNALPLSERRTALLAYLRYKLGAFAEVERGRLRITDRTDRQQFRDDLWSATATAREGVYAAPDIGALLAEWYSELAKASTAADLLPMRLLVLLADIPSPVISGFVGTAFPQLKRQAGDEKRYELSLRLSRALVNTFAPAAGTSLGNALDRFTGDDWRLVRESVETNGDGCGAAMDAAATPVGQEVPAPRGRKGRWWLFGY